MVSSNCIYCIFQLYLSSEIKSKFYAESDFEEFVIKEKEKKNHETVVSENGGVVRCLMHNFRAMPRASTLKNIVMHLKWDQLAQLCIFL